MDHIAIALTVILADAGLPVPLWVVIVGIAFLIPVILIPIVLVAERNKRQRKVCRVCQNKLQPQDSFCPRCGTNFYQPVVPISSYSPPQSGPVTPVPTRATPPLSPQYAPISPMLSRCNRCGMAAHSGGSFCGNCGQLLSPTATRTQWHN